jgi:transcriptional regulator with XRE-family HTH domain
MPSKPTFAQALRTARKARGVSQEQFDTVSSRTYISSLERGLKQPTIAKVDSLAEVLGIHPLSLLVLSYAQATPRDTHALLDRVRKEVDALIADAAAS